jgi:DNA polymerase
MSDAVLALLQWYAEAGVDEALDEAPVDRRQAAPPAEAQDYLAAAAPSGGFAEAAPPAPAALRDAPPWRPEPRLPEPVQPMTRLTGDRAVVDARAQAAKAENLTELEAILSRFDGCGLKETAKNLCFADGNPEAPIMFIGEAPGRDEDIQGKPFVGRAGQLLDRMLAAIGLDRSQAYITNIVFWRPPGNRTPAPAETAVCRPFTERQIELVKPKLLVFLGGAAAKHMLETGEGIMRLRGKWRSFECSGHAIRAMATLHPAYLLRQPLQKRLAWRDFLEIRKALDEAD